MKKTFLFLAAATLLLSAPTSHATISIAATPSTQTINVGGTFNVSFTLTVTQNTAPATVAGFDLYLVTAAINSGYFRITSATATGPFNGFGPNNPNGDPLSMAAATGYVRNGIDQGYIGNAQPTPVSNLALETLTLSVAAGVPNGTYTFLTSSTATAAGFFSRVTDGGGTTYPIDTAGSFSITVVPEPSTWALAAVGGVVTLVLARRHRVRLS